MHRLTEPQGLADVLSGLDPLPRQAVALVYFHGHSPAEAAAILAVERGVLAAALATAFRRIGRSIVAD